jgi:phosphoglycolate phosphatase-like HAD superfamily hydrolase
LVLWDIDHTLIETGGLGGELYRNAFQAVTGRTMERKADVTGQTERAILTATLKLHGIEDDEPYQEAYAVALAAEYRRHEDLLRRRGRALPGAKDALAALAGRNGVVQAPLTGNLRGVAVVKLSVFDLAQFLDIDSGAYGDDDPVRPRLVAIAQRRATRNYGHEFDRESTVVVGDSTNDVRTAHHGGAAIVAVASGVDDEEKLRDAGADSVLLDLIDTDRVVEAVLR